MSAETNKALVRRYYEEVLNGRRLEVLDELLAPAFASHLTDGSSVGREQYQQTIELMHATFPDLMVSVEDQIAEGDKVVTRWTAQGTHQAPFLGIPATGKVVTVSAIHIHRIVDNYIVDHWEAINLHVLLQQLRTASK